MRIVRIVHGSHMPGFPVEGHITTLSIMAIYFNHIRCGVGGALINDRRIFGCDLFPGAVQETLEPKQALFRVHFYSLVPYRSMVRMNVHDDH